MRSVTLLVLALGLVLATTAFAANPVRISQVYGGGGSHYTCDYVELFNNSNAPVDIGGWSVQYGSATGSSFASATYNWARIPSGATIPACGYYLIRGYCSTAGVALPVTPDLAPSSPATWTFNFSGSAGKVALFSDQVAGRTCASAQSSGMLVDLVGYGTANCYETTAAATLDVTSVLVRSLGGSVDTDDNSTDFSRLAASGVTIHNSASAQNPVCQQAQPGAPTLVAPPDGAVDVAVPATLEVTASDPDADVLSVQFYGRAVPPPPAAPVATAGTNVSSTWFQANWNVSSGATGYRLDVASDGGFASYVTGYQDLAVSGTSRVVAGLSPETPYYYRVRAVGDGGTSGNSNTITVTTSATGPVSAECELILLPDTQEYTTQEKGGLIAMFQAQTQWIASHRADRNIVGVAHEGDITDKNNTTEYDRALTATNTLEDPAATGLVDGVPYAMLRGNHDGTTELFNQYYGVSRFSGRGYYGGHYGTGNDQSYMLLSGAGLDFVVVSLSYAPTADVLAWAKGVLEAHPNRVGIVVSHSVLNESATIPASWTSEGTAIYNALRGTANLRLMFGGHMASASGSPAWQGEGRRADTYGGYTIHSMLADYQDRENGGNGKLRIVQFVPAENKVRVRTYSPYTDVWEADADSSSQFTLDVDLSVGLAAAPADEAMTRPASAQAVLADFPLLGTVTGVPSGSTASLEWAGLDPRTEYEWYVKVSDGYTPPVTGPTWSFTTVDAATSVLLSRFTASAVESGVELRWAFSEPGSFGAVAVERAERAEGPWADVAVERREESGESVALDRGARSGNTYWYRIAATLGSTRLTFGPIEVVVGEAVSRVAFSVGPSPSRVTSVSFTLPKQSDVDLSVFDLSGRKVATLAEGSLAPRRHEYKWDGAGSGAGVYFVRLRVGSETYRLRTVSLR